MSGRSSGPNWARSYRRRQGQVTRAQRRALRELWPRYGLTTAHGHTLALDAAFGRDAPTALEIGFGHGEALCALAEARPDWNVLGVEVHRPGIGAAMMRAARADLDNLRVVRGDVMTLLHHHLEGPSFDQIAAFFPEPWPRPKDHHRRLVRPSLMGLLARHARPGAELWMATDIEDYAEHMRQTGDAAPAWHRRWDGLGFAPRPTWRPVTRYEQKALDAGRAIHDLRYGLVAE